MAASKELCCDAQPLCDSVLGMLGVWLAEDLPPPSRVSIDGAEDGEPPKSSVSYFNRGRGLVLVLAVGNGDRGVGIGRDCGPPFQVFSGEGVPEGVVVVRKDRDPSP